MEWAPSIGDKESTHLITIVPFVYPVQKDGNVTISVQLKAKLRAWLRQRSEKRAMIVVEEPEDVIDRFLNRCEWLDPEPVQHKPFFEISEDVLCNFESPIKWCGTNHV